MTRDDHDSLVRRQFGASAGHYRTSASHARGRSLSRLLALAAPRPHWRVLDVATGAGHAAATLAPRVALVVAGDLTREMLLQAQMVGRDKALDNIRFVQESAQALSYRDAAFELVVCRVAAHHFPDPDSFVAESARVLKPGGALVVIDNIVSGDPAAAAWINDFEKQRDPSHARCLDPGEWRAIYARHGLTMDHEEVSSKWFDFAQWMQRMNVPADAMARLGDRLLSAPQNVRDFWQPRRENGRIQLALQEAILVGRARPAGGA